MTPEANAPMPSGPPPEGTKVAEGEIVLRISKPPQFDNLSDAAQALVREGKALLEFFVTDSQFELSTADKKHNPPRLSVWVATLTTPCQAWVFRGAAPAARVVISLTTDDIRKIRAPAVPGFAATACLDVEFEPKGPVEIDGVSLPDTRPGYQGHAGITNLKTGNSTQKESLRIDLATIAKASVLSEDEMHACRSASE